VTGIPLPTNRSALAVAEDDPFVAAGGAGRTFGPAPCAPALVVWGVLAHASREGDAMNRILVADGTGHGRTGEIALAIGEQLTRAGRNVDVRPCLRARSARAHTALVMVGAVQDRRWEPGVLQYLDDCGDLPPRWTRLVEWQPSQSTDDATADPHVDALREQSGLPQPVRFRAPSMGWDPSNLAALWPARAFEDDQQQWGDIRGWARTLAIELADQLTPAA
jgi:hypothetical protein